MSQGAQYQGLRFSYSAMVKDISGIKRLAASFLSPGGSGALDQCRSDLECIRNATTERSWTWQIRQDQPHALRTEESKGEYRDSAKQDGIAVYGLLAFTWDIRNADRGIQRQRHFCLDGRASTSLIIKSSSDNTVVAQWQFEAGDASSPGCHFHSAVNQYGSDGLFPEWLKVPRFPGLLFCPMDALEFLLGELFQRRWLQTVSKSSRDRDAWGKSQQHRLERLLKWELDQVAKWDTTPWMSLKKAKPPLKVITE